METTISMEAIWTFLRSLSLSSTNREWLADKLLNDEFDIDLKKRIREEYDQRFAPEVTAKRLADSIHKIEEGSFQGVSFEEFESEMSQKYPWLEEY